MIKSSLRLNSKYFINHSIKLKFMTSATTGQNQTILYQCLEWRWKWIGRQPQNKIFSSDQKINLEAKFYAEGQEKRNIWYLNGPNMYSPTFRLLLPLSQEHSHLTKKYSWLESFISNSNEDKYLSLETWRVNMERLGYQEHCLNH